MIDTRRNVHTDLPSRSDTYAAGTVFECSRRIRHGGRAFEEEGARTPKVFSEDAASGRDVLPGDPAARVCGEKRKGLGDILGLADTIEG